MKFGLKTAIFCFQPVGWKSGWPVLLYKNVLQRLSRRLMSITGSLGVVWPQNRYFHEWTSRIYQPVKTVVDSGFFGDATYSGPGRTRKTLNQVDPFTRTLEIDPTRSDRKLPITTGNDRQTDFFFSIPAFFLHALSNEIGFKSVLWNLSQIGYI